MKECTTCGKKFYQEEGEHHQHRCIWCEKHRLKPCKDCGKTFTFNMPHDKFCIDCQNIRIEKTRLKQKEYNRKYQLTRKLGIKAPSFDKKQYKLQCVKETYEKYLNIHQNKRTELEMELIKLEAALQVTDELIDFTQTWYEECMIANKH